jgi:hypothetical protein
MPIPASLLISGCSARQGTHQLANTLTTLTWPFFRSAVANPGDVPPATGGRMNSGAGLSIRAEGMIFGSLVRPTAK